MFICLDESGDLGFDFEKAAVAAGIPEVVTAMNKGRQKGRLTAALASGFQAAIATLNGLSETLSVASTGLTDTT